MNNNHKFQQNLNLTGAFVVNKIILPSTALVRVKNDYFFVLETRKFSLLTAAISKTKKKFRSDKSECLNTLRYTKFEFLRTGDEWLAVFIYLPTLDNIQKNRHIFGGIYGEGPVPSHI